MASIDEGTVLGGRYEITGRIMASAQQDLVLTGLDQVLNREVLILVASRENASQAAQSARQLATGERSSSIQILDLGLSDDRTYLVAPGNADVEDFLALLTNEDIYVEPFFTEHLGTELFGESRQRTPQTYEDDTEYYAELREDLAEEPDPSKRPEFLNKISDRIDNWLQEDEDETRVVPGQVPPAATGAAAAGAAASTGSTRKPKTPEPKATEPATSESERDEQPAEETRELSAEETREFTTEKASEPAAEETFPPAVAEDTPEPAAEDTRDVVAEEQPTQIVHPSTEQQQQAPVPVPTPAAAQQAKAQQQAKRPTAKPFLPPPPPDEPYEPNAEDGYAIEYTDEKPRSNAGRWIGGILLVGVLVFAVVMGFRVLGGPEDEEPPVANMGSTTNTSRSSQSAGSLQ